ncbi:phosphodiester glycosidase family protein [Intestinimonas massiliensis (ex Afouda et al. 2020)]|uniref:phosphodiester glycosidase family protein n=1 Tax=Intestinimonas massiliensis (ex Afouda et al. 2020) TaxID=1673721 RepID=UPI001030A508|nr:phosphodiester glycosidase family protein [Intestinimonas massiliensis (ex Afouda et al. 2020)]
MKKIVRRGTALGLALVMTVTAAAASNALGWDVHKSSVPISQGTTMGKNIFWSDTYSDLRTEYYVSYAPNENVVPTVAYGNKILSKATLSGMAQTLESQGKRVVSGLNGDWYVVATGATTGLVVTNGAVRATPYYTTSWAIGFQTDGSAFIAQTGLTTQVTFGGKSYPLTGAINKVRQVNKNGVGGLTLLTSDFASTTQNTQAGVDVVLTPVDDGTGTSALEPTIGKTVTYTVDQVLESTGPIAIPEGKAVLTMNASDDANTLAALRALKAGDTVTLSITAADERWNTATEALGGVYKIVTNGQVASGLDASRTACSAIGIKADGTLVFYAMDGSQPGYSVGANLTQVAKRLVELGCVDAISMDGGGSTTIGVTYPDKNGMQVVNKPSDGTQRSNSTAIFLTTTLQPTGQLAGYYVTPSDQMLLSGAQVQLSAAGLDTSYYTTTGNPVSWSVTSGGGTVSESGLYTAGTESGFSQVTASDGTYSGTAYLTTVKTPDSISITNESTGASVKSLNLNPGGQVNLKASAVYRKLSLTAQDTCFTWTVQGDVGTVDQNGLFTASAKSGSGSIVVSAGGKSVTIPVSVAGHIKTLESFEGSLSGFASTATASAQAETGLDHVHNGKQSLKLTYQAGATGAASLTTNLTIPSGESWIGMWVYGDGSGNTLMATADGQNAGQFLLTALDFTGWKYVMVQLPDGVSSITELSVVYGGGEDKQNGTVWLDQMVTANEKVADTAAPTVTVKRSGTQLTATVKDDVDQTIAQGNVSVTYDGTAVQFTWNESAGTLTATLPAADNSYHRATVTVSDASGNLARASADMTPSTQRTSPFGDMTGHWAEPYATFLYDQGISQGTGGDVPQYQPNRNITRAEFFAMVAHWMDLDLTQYSGVELPFADKDKIPSWALNEIKAMYSLGLLQGAESAGGLMSNPTATITRAEAITLLGRTQAKGYAQADLSAFTDAAQVPGWAAEYTKVLVGQGVVAGSNGQIRPTGLLTRGEVAKLLYAML